MEKVLAPVLGKFAFVYLDDIIITGETLEAHKKNLDEVFSLLANANLQLNWKKCKFVQEYTEFLGFVFGQGTIQVSPKKTEAVVNFPRPNTVKKLRGFLALVSWLRRFVPHLAEQSAPLTEMLKKNVPFVWTPERDAAFQDIKAALVEPPILFSPDFDFPFEIHCNASDVSLGAVLLQSSEGHPHIIAYASRLLAGAERNYSVTEKECLAVLFAVERWRHYIQGQKTVVYTDHSSLTWLNLKLGRWVTRLTPYDLVIKYKRHVLPDFLSRSLHAIQITPLSLDFSHTTDNWYLSLRERIKKDQKAFPMFQLDQTGRIFKKVRDPFTQKLEPRIIIPADLRENMLQHFHCSPLNCHMGVNKTHRKLLENCYWPGMRISGQVFIRKCALCQQYKSSNTQASGTMTFHDKELKPFDTITMDLTGAITLVKSPKPICACSG